MLYTPSHIDINAIINEVHKISGVKKLYHIHVWYLNEEEVHLEAHLECLEDIKSLNSTKCCSKWNTCYLINSKSTTSIFNLNIKDITKWILLCRINFIAKTKAIN